MIQQFLAVVVGATMLASLAHASEPRNLPLRQLSSARDIQPSRAAAYALVNGRIMLTSDWVTPRAGVPRSGYVAAFDAIELDMSGSLLGPPTDQTNPPGPTGCRDDVIPNGSRWYIGAGYTNPFFAADLTPSTAGAGAFCQAVAFAWFVGMGPAEPDDDGNRFPDSPMYIAIHQFETMDVTGCTDPGSEIIDGVIYEFHGPPGPEPEPYYNVTVFFNVDGLGHTMPSGSGGYQFIFGVAFDPKTGEITLPSPIDEDTGRGINVQPMLWGTGGNEAGAPDDGRAGVDVDGQFDWLDGENDPLKCYTYLFGVCPDPLAAAVGFYYTLGEPCACAGDVDGDGQIAIADLTALLSLFGAACPCEVPCVDANADHVVDISDLALFLSRLGFDCP